MKIFGQLERAQIENRASDPVGVGLVPGRVWYRTDQKLYKVYDGALVQTFIDLDTAQTLVNKTLTAPLVTSPEINGATTYNEIATPTTPGANKNKVYFKSDGFPYYLDDAAIERRLGSGTGFGDVGVYSVFNAEDVSTVGLTNISLNATTPIAGIYDYSVTSYIASFPVITLFPRSLEKLNGISLQYKMTSGSAKLVVKDNASNTLVEQIISSTVIQKVSLQFYVNSAVTSVQLSIESVAAPVGLKIDDVVFTDSPFVSTKLSNDTDWIAYTPIYSGFSAVTNIESFYRQKGDGIEIRGKFVSNTNAASEARVGLPLGLVSASTTKIPTLSVAGIATRDVASTSTNDFRVLMEPSVSYVTFSIVNNGAVTGLTKRLASELMTTGPALSYQAIIPIEGFSSHSENLVFSQSGTENDFSARLNSGSTTITSQSSPNNPAIASVTTGAAGICTVNFTSNFFSVIPAIKLTPSGGATQARYTAVSTSSCTIETSNSAGTLLSADFTIEISRQGSDYKNPNAYAVVPSVQIAYLKDVKPNGTNGQSITSGSYVTRILNTIEGSSFVTLSANQFTLPAGSYDLHADVPGFRCNAHKAQLYNITTASVAKLGKSAYADNSAGASDTSSIFHSFTITTTTTFEIRHRVGVTDAAAGGVNSGFGDDNTYTQIKITKLR